jgi:hypothetical protein
MTESRQPRTRARGWVKGGQHHKGPVQHELEARIDAYIEAAGIPGDEKGLLSRSAKVKIGTLIENRMSLRDLWRLIC